MTKKSAIILFLFLSFLFAAKETFAGTPPGPPGGGGTPPCWPPPCTIPLDGGISLLIAAGVALGGKKIYDSRKSGKES